jgi:hypothetical protein
MANTIKIKRSATPTQAPSTLDHGELALNYADGKLFYKNSSNAIVEFTSAASLAGTVYNATIGDGTSTSFVLTHNFGSRDVSVTIREAASPYGLILTSWEATSSNTITVYFDSPPSSSSVRISVYIAVAGLEVGPTGPTGLTGPTGPTGPAGSIGTAILDDLTDTVVTSPATGQMLRYNGTNWVNYDNTITLGGNFTTSGAFTTTLTATATTSVTLPTTGTLSTLDGTETFTNKTFTSPVTNTPTLTLSTSSSTTDARIFWDSTNKKIRVGNGTISLDFASSNVITNAQAASYTLVLGDKDKLVEISNASANTLTVPLNSSVAFPIGTQITILQTGAGATTITATGGVTVNATPGLILRAQWSSVTLIKRAENTWVALGDLRA